MLFGRSKNKIVAFALLAIFAIGIMTLAPERLFERAGTIQEHSDRSSQMRLESWYVAWHFALDHPFGGGFWVLDHDEVYSKYLTTYVRAQSAHNIYFEILANQGFPGLGLYIGLIVSSYMSLFRLKWQLRNNPAGEWVVNYCKMIQISLAAFMIGGMFLPLSYWDFFYHIISFVILLRAVAVKDGLLNPVAVAARGLEPWQVQLGVSRI
jgi:probable O-glycosylation ligase (exosortase A-associated)